MKSASVFAVIECSLLLGVAPSCTAQVMPVENQITLEIDGREIKPLQVREKWEQLHWCGGRAFVMKGNSICEVSAASGQTLWELKTTEPGRLTWIGAAGNVAYLAAVSMNNDDNSEPQHLLRCDLTAKQWLSQWAPPVEKGGKPQVIVDAIVSAKRVVMMSVRQDKGQDKDQEKNTCCITDFEADRNAPAWSVIFPLEGERPSPGMYLLAPIMPDFAHSSLARLTWVGDNILACGSERSSLVYLSPEGKVLWEVPRIWEFQRGFIGPSVWTHYISRFGGLRGFLENSWEPVAPKDDPKQTPDEKKQAAEKWKDYTDARDAFEKQFQCAIVGGPIIVREPGATDPDDFSIFVAVSKGPNGFYAGYLSDCIVYQLSPDANIIAMTNLPRMVNGGQFRGLPRGVIWACQQNSYARILERDGSFDNGMDDDCLCPIDWYRQFKSNLKADDAWLTTDKVPDVSAFSDRLIFTTLSGGSIPASNHHLMQFEITYIDQKTGIDHKATLNVPLQGDVKVPAMHTSVEHDKKGEHISVRGPYLLGITGFEIHKSQVQILLGGEKSATGITFDEQAFETGK